MKTAVQQIMLGTVTGSETQARNTLQRIKAAGYDGLELNRFMIHPSSLMIRLMTRAAGMPTGKGANLNWKACFRNPAFLSSACMPIWAVWSGKRMRWRRKRRTWAPIRW